MGNSICMVRHLHPMMNILPISFAAVFCFHRGDFSEPQDVQAAMQEKICFSAIHPQLPGLKMGRLESISAVLQRRFEPLNLNPLILTTNEAKMRKTVLCIWSLLILEFKFNYWSLKQRHQSIYVCMCDNDYSDCCNPAKQNLAMTI